MAVPSFRRPSRWLRVNVCFQPSDLHAQFAPACDTCPHNRESEILEGLQVLFRINCVDTPPARNLRSRPSAPPVQTPRCIARPIDQPPPRAARWEVGDESASQDFPHDSPEVLQDFILDLQASTPPCPAAERTPPRARSRAEAPPRPQLPRQNVLLNVSLTRADGARPPPSPPPSLPFPLPLPVLYCSFVPPLPRSCSFVPPLLYAPRPRARRAPPDARRAPRARAQRREAF